MRILEIFEAEEPKEEPGFLGRVGNWFKRNDANIAARDAAAAQAAAQQVPGVLTTSDGTPVTSSDGTPVTTPGSPKPAPDPADPAADPVTEPESTQVYNYNQAKPAADTKPAAAKPAADTEPAAAAKPAPAKAPYLGSAGSQAIQQLNPGLIKDVNKIYPGQQLKMPDGSTYTVKKGDALDRIARQAGAAKPEAAKPEERSWLQRAIGTSDQRAQAIQQNMPGFSQWNTRDPDPLGTKARAAAAAEKPAATEVAAAQKAAADTLRKQVKPPVTTKEAALAPAKPAAPLAPTARLAPLAPVKPAVGLPPVAGQAQPQVENLRGDRGYQENDPVVGAITRRIMHSHLDLLSKHGPEAVVDAIDDVAGFVGKDLQEIGTSDVSGWVKEVELMLNFNAKKKQNEGVTEGSIEGGVWTANPPTKGQKPVPAPSSPDGGSAPPSKPAPRPNKKAEVGADDQGVAEAELNQPTAPVAPAQPAAAPVAQQSPEQIAYNQLRAQLDSADALRGNAGGKPTYADVSPEVTARTNAMKQKLAQMAAPLKTKGIDAAAEYDAPDPAVPADEVRGALSYTNESVYTVSPQPGSRNFHPQEFSTSQGAKYFAHLNGGKIQRTRHEKN